MRSVVVGLEMPADFPTGAYDAVAQVVMARAPNGISRREFNGAWNATAYRYLAADELDRAFRASVEEHGAAPPVPERYRQERDLFGFFANVGSMLDSLGYALHCVGAAVLPARFPLATTADRQRVTFARTAARYHRRFPDTALQLALEAIQGSPERSRAAELRAVLTHRSSTPHPVWQAEEGDDVPSVTSQPDLHDRFVLTAELSADTRRWVGGALASVVPATLAFVRGTMPVRIEVPPA